MKKSNFPYPVLCVAFCLLMLLPAVSQAQWSATDGSIVSDANKNVGIGTSTPNPSGSLLARFTVRGGVTNSDWALKLQGSTSQGAVEWVLGTSEIGWAAGPGKFLINTGATNASTLSPFAIVAASGNVGIGDTDPRHKLYVNGDVCAAQILVGISNLASTTPFQDYKLAVGGKVIAEEVNVKLQANWPDYVFENTYKLPSLLEVDRYIRENKHLPEVPTAQEVKEKGLAVGEMNAILLKKIEELTLYLVEFKKESIESQKKVADLQKEIEALKAR